MEGHDLWNDWVSAAVYREYVDSYPLPSCRVMRACRLYAIRPRARRQHPIRDLSSLPGARSDPWTTFPAPEYP